MKLPFVRLTYLLYDGRVNVNMAQVRSIEAVPARQNVPEHSRLYFGGEEEYIDVKEPDFDILKQLEEA